MRKLTLLLAAILLANTQIFADYSVGNCFVSGDLRYKITSISPNTVEVTAAGGEANQYYPLTAGTTSVTIPVKVKDPLNVEYTVTKIGGATSKQDAPNAAFYKSAIQTIHFAEGSQVTEIGDYTFASSATASVTLPEGLTAIGQSAFNGCKALQAITIPATVSSIAPYAFNNCTALASVTVLSTNAASIPMPGEGAFENIATSAVLNIPFETKALYEDKGWNQWFTIDVSVANNQIFYRSSDHQIIEPTTNAFGVNITSNTYNAEADYGVITFDGNLTTIGENAFSERKSLKTIALPASVITIGKNAFCDCTGLTSFDFPASLTTIGYQSFQHCSSLAYVTIGNFVTTIDRYAFSECTSLKTITIPASVTSIGVQAFYMCTSLSSVTFEGNLCQNNIGENAFYKVNTSSTTKLTLPDSWGNSYLPTGMSFPWYGAYFNSNRYYSLDVYKSDAIAKIEAEMTKFSNWSDQEIAAINGYKESITIAINRTEVDDAESAALNFIALHENKIAALAAINEALGDYAENEAVYTMLIAEINAICAAIDVETITDNKNTAIAILPTLIDTYEDIFADGKTAGKADALGELATPCDNCHAVKVKKGAKTVILYAPEEVSFEKVQQEK